MPTMYHQRLNLAFVHIPKCAGITVTTYLAAGKDGPGKAGSLAIGEVVLLASSSGWQVGSQIDGLIDTINLNNSHYSYRLRHTDHARAIDIRQHMGAKAYDCLDSFTVVRDPWTRIESMYHYIRKNPTNPRHELAHSLSFEDFIWWHCDNACSPQSEWIFSPDCKQLVNTIVRAEELNSFLHTLLHRIFNIDSEVGKWNSSASSQLPKYHSYKGIMPETLDKIRQSYALDFELLGYSLEKPDLIETSVPIGIESLRKVTDAWITKDESLDAVCDRLGLNQEEVLAQHRFYSSLSLYNSATENLNSARKRTIKLENHVEMQKKSLVHFKSKLTNR